MINKKAETAVEETGSEVVNIIISAIVIIFLIFLIYIIYNFYTEKENISRATSELNEIYLSLQTAYERQAPLEYTPSYAPEWFLFSSEFPELCQPGPFCLCMCKNFECNNKRTRACIATDKFVMIRGPESDKYTEQRTIVLDPLKNIKLSSIKEIATPFNGATESYELGWSGIGTPIPIYYKFHEGKWQWSLDLKYWQDTSTQEVSGGVRAGERSNVNLVFIKSLDQFLQHSSSTEAAGHERFRNLKATESIGFYLIEK